MSSERAPASPYKFLAYYRLADKDLFFGREQETEALVADIVLNRLVVLFAKTGTGKTSLINAGVRPQLHDRDYTTCFIRVRRDPDESARRRLARLLGRDFKGGTLAARCREAAGSLESPLVLIFDQFEEFFIYVKGDSPRGRQFISDIAELYRDSKSGIHLVFSMREEFLHEMDDFRPEIPTIFHKDSTLRLRGFEPDDAHAGRAIAGPASHAGRPMEPKLVQTLINDLSGGPDGPGRIDPTHLQIVCDTLWAASRGPVITLEDYRALGDYAGRGQNVSKQILDRRLADEFGLIEDEGQLELLERLLPALRTEENTKKVRDVDGLAKELEADRARLEQLLGRLESSRLVQRAGRGDSALIELTHDYLADERRIETWRDHIRDIRLGRAAGRGALSPDELAQILESINDWRLTPERATLFFRSSLKHGLDMRRWFDLASRHGGGVWVVLREALERDDDAETQANALDLLREVQSRESVELLGLALARPNLWTTAKSTLEVAAHSRRPDVADRAAKILRESKAPPEREPPDEGADAARGASPGSSAASEPPYEEIRDEMAHGRVVPFLGAGASSAALRPAWENLTPLISSGAGSLQAGLVNHLARLVGFSEARSLDEVAQYYEYARGRRQLDEEVRRFFSRDPRPTRLHALLAAQPRPLLIVTTNYDDLVERAFEAAGRSFDLVTTSPGTAHGDSVLWRRHGAAEAVPVSPGALDIDLKTVTVVYKIFGSAAPGPEPGSFIITEADYVDFIGHVARYRVIPAVFAERLQTSRFLFLGFDTEDRFLRSALLGIERSLRRPKRLSSWAVQPGVSEFTRRFWASRSVESYDMEVEAFAERLAG